MAHFRCPWASSGRVRTRLTVEMPSSSPPPPLLSQVLTDVVKTTTEWAAEGQTLFAPIAAIWDDYLQLDMVRQLLVRLCKPLEALCKEISQTATIHFDSYIKGIRPTKTTSQPLLVTDEQNT